jgi:putative membrane protein
MKKWLLCGTLAAGVLFSGCDKDDDENESNNTDRNFVKMAAIANSAEVLAGQLAATKGTDPLVTSFGQMMVSEHTLAQNELKTNAGSQGFAVADTVDPAHQAIMARLNTLTGYEFDTAYMNSQVKDHLNTLTLFQTEVYGGRNESIKGYAIKYAPHIQMHLIKADSVRAAIQ